MDSDFVARRTALSAILAKSAWFQGVTLDGEGQSGATAHNILEIEESCREIVELIETAERGSVVDTEQFASDIREALRHILYHVADDRFLKLVL